MLTILLFGFIIYLTFNPNLCYARGRAGRGWVLPTILQLLIILLDVPQQEDTFNLGPSAAIKFCGWVQVGIDVYIPHQVYQVKPYLLPRFSSTWATIITHRNPLFDLATWTNQLYLRPCLDKLVIVAKESLNLSNLIWILIWHEWILVHYK